MYDAVLCALAGQAELRMSKGPCHGVTCTAYKPVTYRPEGSKLAYVFRVESCFFTCEVLRHCSAAERSMSRAPVPTVLAVVSSISPPLPHRSRLPVR